MEMVAIGAASVAFGEGAGATLTHQMRVLVLGHGLDATESNSVAIATPDGVDRYSNVEWEFDPTTKQATVHAPEGPVSYHFLGEYVWERAQ